MAEESNEANKENLRVIGQADQLRGMMTTTGWIDVAEPILTKMIQDASGYKKADGTWQMPRIDSSMTTNDLKWYRQALVDFNNHLFNFFTLAEDIKKMYKNKEIKKDKEYVMPMKDTSYAESIND